MLKEQRDTCIFQLEERLDRESMEECRNFIKIQRESRHYKTLEWQRNKSERLCQRKKSAESTKSDCSNIQDGDQNNTANNNTNWQRIGTATLSQIPVQGSNIRWVRNISSTPLTEAQIKLLSHGPNYMVIAENPPIAEYIAAIEKACTSLQPGKAEELRGKVKTNSKKMQHPKYNLTKEKNKAMEDLKKEQDQDDLNH